MGSVATWLLKEQGGIKVKMIPQAVYSHLGRQQSRQVVVDRGQNGVRSGVLAVMLIVQALTSHCSSLEDLETAHLSDPKNLRECRLRL